MKLHESWRPRMQRAAKSLYGKIDLCSAKRECGEKRVMLAPTETEITLIFWMLQDLAKENGFKL